MTERTIARRYVRALFELALEQRVADGVLEDLARANQRLAADVAVAAVLFDPRADAKKKKAAAAKVTEGPGGALVKDFAAFLVDHGRVELLPLAHEEFGAMLREHRNEAIAEVVSAAPLDGEAKRSLIAALEGITKKKIALQEQVDPTLLGGMRVKVGSMLLDGSVQRRLTGMRDDLLRVALPR